MDKQLQTTAQEFSNFVIFKIDNSKVNIDVLFQDETLWLTQKKMAELFETTPQNITLHLKNIYNEQEQDESATCKEFLQVQKEGSREVKRLSKYYNLKAIVAVGYRVNSHRAIEFRKWATAILEEYIIKGFAMDDERLKQIKHFGKDYFDEQLERIREIRASERRFYQKITDIYALSADYDKNADITSDVTIAKNYLNEEHIKKLDRIVVAYLELAEIRASQGIVMNMKDWIMFLDKFLALSDYPILLDNGKVSALEAKLKAEAEYEKYRVVQDRLFMSDFDKLLIEMGKGDE